MNNPNYEDVISESWEELLPLLLDEYRRGFECGHEGRFLEFEPRMSDAYSQGYARGYELFQIENAANVAGETNYDH